MLGDILKSMLFARRVRPIDRCQQECQAAVAIQTVLRPSVERAIRSVFEQDLSGRIHLLLGVDKRLGRADSIDRLLDQAPSNICVTKFDPGYSTSVRHGGVHSNHFGGAIRTILSFAANSRYVAYLDDDDWYAPNHLSTLLHAIRGRDWAFSQRWFVNPFNLEPMCIDTAENMGPNAGIYAQYGGFACPSSLMIDKLACSPILHVWSHAGRPEGDAEDRVFFKSLCELSNTWGATNAATVNCVIKPEDGMHSIREQLVINAGYPIERLRQAGEHSFARV